MKIIALIIGSVTRIVMNIVLMAALAGILWIAYRVNQPMKVPEAPMGMTYYEFMTDRLDAAKTVEPARCGAGMIGTLFVLGPMYATLYTHVALNPDGFLASVTVPDPDIPRNMRASWYEVPGIWWTTFERLSWTMLAKRHPGCNLQPVRIESIKE